VPIKKISPGITVLAGTNGAGKSSVAGVALRSTGGSFYDPDAAARAITMENPAMPAAQANGEAWEMGRRMLEDAIEHRRPYAFETTLGGRTITELLERALDAKIEVRIWYVALDSPERHIARVKSRVAHGGHDIPEEKIRERYEASIANLCRLAPRLTELLVYDNSQEGDPAEGKRPKPVLVLRAARGKLQAWDPARTPHWAKPVVMSLLEATAATRIGVPPRDGRGSRAKRVRRRLRQ
jgi:predicted ABC-type ATPase